VLAVKTTRKLRVLDFDIENRPLSYWIPDRPTAEVTAIAWSWEGSREVEVRLLTHDDQSSMDMLLAFREAYDAADVVTGPVLASDTKLDLIGWKDLPQSQEFLSELYALSRPKHSMTQGAWRDANKLTPSGLAQTRKRVVDDVKQHKQLRRHLVDQEVLSAPTLWEP
jgi:hypothetical protein